MWSTRLLWGLLVGLAIVGSPIQHVADGFNVETKHYAVYRMEERSMFGFAVSTYRDRYARGWAVVGAPEAETAQAGVYRGGAVYKCDIAADDRCNIIHFDDKGHNHVRNPNIAGGLSQIDNKTLQWFGATVSASSKDGGPILACAPRYIWFSVSQPKYDDNRWNKESTAGNRREPVGTCWVVANNFNESQEYSPCRTRYWGYHRQGSCQAGLGAAMSKSGERLFIGAPGSYYWQGQIYSIATAMKLKFVATMLVTEAEASGQAFSQPLNGRSRIMFTKEGPAKEDDSYMGYSVATGDFVGNGDSGTAVGVPRGSDLLGKVILFTSNMTNPRNLTGEQMGAYFGYAVAAGDIDGDGLDDLIVGAPMYTVPDNPEMTIETGRIYVIYQGDGAEKFRKFDTRDGESNRGRFGLSLASLGDIDRDGYGDFVVGAPYGGPNGRGAVYIYHGSRTGVLEKYSQVIHAEDLDNPVQTFGFSVAGGLDLDGNVYPDLVVGAYESGAAMFFRSRPVIKMDSYVVFDSESKLISLDDRNCTLSDNTRVTCFPLRACFRYSGEGVLTRHNFNIQYVLDVKKTKNPRLFFLELEGRNTMNHTITVERDRQFCRTVQVYVIPNIRDKLTSLDAEMRMSLEEERIPDNRRRDPRMPLRPVLGATTSRKDTLSIRKNCGSDNICIPNLQLSVKSNVGRYLLGSGKRLELEVLVQNAGEDAFEATYNLQLPAGIDYIKIERVETLEIPVHCSAPKQSNNNTLRCDIGNPLPQKKLVKFKVLLQPVTSHGMKPIYEFDMHVNTTNPEDSSTSYDNSQHLSLPIWIETDVRVDGESKPKDLYYNPDNYTAVNITTELELGPAVTHNYTIRNQGPSDIVEAEAFLVWPAQTLSGKILMYLLEQPETAGPIACESANANYLSLKLDQRRRVHLNYPDYSGVILDESQSGRTINVQRGFEIDHNKVSQKEEAEISSGDSSNIQKSRHHFSSSSSSSASSSSTAESRRIQLNAGEKPEVLTTTYTHNSSGTSSNGSSDSSSNRGGVVFHTESSGSYGSTTLGGGFRGSEEESFGSRLPDLEQSYGTRTNQSVRVESRWQESGEAQGHTISPPDRYDSVMTESERRYQELLRQQEEVRLRQEEETRQRKLQEEETQRRKLQEEETQWRKLQEEETQRRKLQEEALLIRQQEEQEHIALQRHREELERRRQEEEWRKEEEERQRQQEVRRLQEEREHRYNYDEERRYGVTTDGYHRTTEDDFITGDREETVGSQEFGLHNVSSTQELERIFGTLSKDATGYQLYNRQGQQYVQFKARFRTSADRKEYIEFQDGSMFPLQDRYGGQSYVSESTEPRDSRFLRIEGHLLVASDGKGYIVLKDGRRFPLQGSFTHTEERTYTLRGPHDSYQGGDVENQGQGTHSQSWNEESSSLGATSDGGYESRYNTRTHEERRTEERTSNTRVYGRNRERFDDEFPTNRPDPNFPSSRYRRESDVVDVEEFKKFERFHRHRRDLETDDFPSDATTFQDDDYYQENDPESQIPVPPCDAAKCVMLRCVLGPLKKDQEVWISARYRVDARTLKEVALKEKVKVSTKLVARVTKQPFIGTPAEQVIRSDEVTTNIEPSAAPSTPDMIPIWVVVLSACAGMIILLLLIYLLYKCGFFKRNRPSDAPERQPLNRNGHFQQGEDH
ncbi:integrin alpha-PS2 isoform X1 [Temnothorax curvispinosus]|uniref:Integrin alpha-PS2 isoform X1 n=1 Tax=Temnothorax curvispinosus TaxID=300111 RepID=A0A6J1PWK3_9HYME|nr:integrin alpha-PS2 isoform X1 [Temnothorax curvispinosus]